METIGWIGLGKMGVPMALNLIDAGYLLKAYNRTMSKARPVIDKGATVFNSPDEVMQADVIFMMVTDDAAVKEIFTGESGLLSTKIAGKVIVNMSTVSPAISREMAARCKAMDCEYIDAPVSGSVKQAQEASLVIMAGGDLQAYEKIKPILEKLGKLIIHVGEAGKGNAAKLAVNAFLSVITQGLAESVRFAEKMDISREVFLHILQNTSVASPYIVMKSNAILHDNYQAAFTLNHLVKDLQLAKYNGLDYPLAQAAYETSNAAAIDFGNEDLMAIIKYLKG